MKVRKLVRKIYEACFNHDVDSEKKIWLKLLKKSLKHKRTHLIR